MVASPCFLLALLVASFAAAQQTPVPTEVLQVHGSGDGQASFEIMQVRPACLRHLLPRADPAGEPYKPGSPCS